MSFTLKVIRNNGTTELHDIGREPEISLGETADVQAVIRDFRGNTHKVYAKDSGFIMNSTGRTVHAFNSPRREFVNNGFDAPPAPAFGVKDGAL